MAGAFSTSLALPGGYNISFIITTDNIVVARELCELAGYVYVGIGVTTLGVLLGYRLFKPLIEDVVNVVFGYRRGDQDDPNTETGSLHVLLHCLTDERFLEVLEDYESGGIKERLQKELSEVGIKVEGLKVEIENLEEVEKTRAAIHERTNSKDKKPVQDTTSHVPPGSMGGVFAFVVTAGTGLVAGAAVAAVGALSSIALEEVTKELGATVGGLTKTSAVDNVVKPPLHELGKAILPLQDSGAPPFPVKDIFRDVCITAVSLGALYFGYKLLRPVIDAAVKKGLGGERDDQDIPRIKPGSLHILLRCFTDKRFLEVLADYESGKIKERLHKEFSEVGIEVEGMTVEIENMEEVEETRAAINKRSSEVISEDEAQKLLCHPTEVTSEDEAQKSLCHPTEMMAEDEAKKTKETYFLATHDEKKLSTGNDQDHSKEHGNWLTVGELMYSIRKPVSTYVDKIVKAFHENLCKDLLHAGKCNSPDDCIKKTTDDGLCNSCKHWFRELEASHENSNNPSWYENCNSAKWSENHWEVAKFFMPALILSPVEDAESTDLSSLLNVLEFMKDDAFHGKARVNMELVRKLRSRVKNVWVHAPEQEFTNDEKEKSFWTATKFLEDLEKVCPNTENTKCLELLKRLKTSRFIVQTNN